MPPTLKNISIAPTKHTQKLFFQNFIMHTNGPDGSCSTKFGDNRPLGPGPVAVLISYLSRGGDEGETAHAPCVRRGGVNGYSHLLNGLSEAGLTSHPCNFLHSVNGDTPILIEDPEENKVIDLSKSTLGDQVDHLTTPVSTALK